MSSRVIIPLLVVSVLLAIEFSSEFLRFDVSPEWVDTYGEFYMTGCDEFGKPALLLFPFVPDSALGKAQDIEVYGLDGNELTWHWARRDTLLGLPCPQKPCGFIIEYRTPFVHDKFIYILKSVQLWGEPLDSCKIEVRFSQSLPVKMSYPVDTLFFEDSIAIARFLFKNFMPQSNFVIEIEDGKHE